MNGDVNNTPMTGKLPANAQSNGAGLPNGPSGSTPEGVTRDNGGDKGQTLQNVADSSFSESKGST